MTHMASMEGLKGTPGIDEAQELLKSDWATVLNTPSGRRVLWEILQATGWDEPAKASRGADQMFLEEGSRRIGLTIYKAIETFDLRVLAQMKAEYAALPVGESKKTD